MIERLFKLRPTIEQTIFDLDSTTFFNSLHGSHHQKSFTNAKAIWTNVKRYTFWDTYANFIHMVELILMSLRAFDGKQPCMGKAWLIMKTLEWHVLSLWNALFELPSNFLNVIKDQFYQRWKMLTTDLHYVGAFLNPYLLGEACLHDDVDAKEA